MNSHLSNRNRLRVGLGGIAASVALLTLAFVLGLSGTARAATPNPLKFSPEWEKAIVPLRAMPVQDTGFIRSAYTFAENRLMDIADKRSFHGANPLDVVLHLMAEPHLLHTTPIIKITRPEVGKIFGAGHVSLGQYTNPDNQQMVANLVRSNQDKWGKPMGELQYRVDTLQSLESEFAIVPRRGNWLSPTEAEKKSDLDAVDRKILSQWDKLKTAIQSNDVAAGAAAARELTDTVDAAAKQRDVVLPDLSLDVFYHSHQPFSKAAWWYVLAALAYAGSWLFARPKISWIGYGFLVLGFVEQVIGVVSRWILSGRAPLSNMFESFTFAIGGMVLVALVFELFNRTRLVGLGAAILGFIFMVLAHKAPIFNSQIRPLMPALQSSWLTYHVVTIMLSYSAFALSFFVGLIYLTKDVLFHGDRTSNVFVRRLPSLSALDVFNYRIIAIGFPLLTLGIIFGAVWAATAWGRPWGFDPKETWSAITWLIYAMYLHVRFLAGWKGRRAAIFAILGFLAVLFTYLGVNYLLPGLHSYASS